MKRKPSCIKVCDVINTEISLYNMNKKLMLLSQNH